MTESFKSIGYLSGAPSVSTRSDAAADGPRSHILGVIEGFRQSGWDVHPFIVGDLVPEEMVKNKARNITRKNAFSRFLADIIRILTGLYYRWRAVKHLPEVSVVYERFGSFQGLGRGFQKRGAKWILETNGPSFAEANQERKSLSLTGIARKMEVSAYQQCDLLVCVSKPLKEILTQDLNLDPRKIVVIPNGVDVGFFSPGNSDPIRYFDYPTIGYVGAVIERQGLDLLMEVVASLKTEALGIGLVIVGDGRSKNDLENLAEKLKITDQVKFTGHVPRDDVPGTIAGFDLGYSGQLVLGEGMLGKMYHSPLKIYEYLAMGKPVIASTYEDAESVIKQGETGYLFSPADPESLRKAVLQALNNKDRWADMGKIARIEIITNHSWANRVRKIISCIDALEE